MGRSAGFHGNGSWLSTQESTLCSTSSVEEDLMPNDSHSLLYNHVKAQMRPTLIGGAFMKRIERENEKF